MHNQADVTLNAVLAKHRVPESNAFLMSRFRESEFHRQILTSVAYTLRCYGMAAIRADEQAWAETLWASVQGCMRASRYGIAVFETYAESDINPNVSLELGYMLAGGSRCLLARESTGRESPRHQATPDACWTSRTPQYGRARVESALLLAGYNWPHGVLLQNKPPFIGQQLPLLHGLVLQPAPTSPQLVAQTLLSGGPQHSKLCP